MPQSRAWWPPRSCCAQRALAVVRAPLLAPTCSHPPARRGRRDRPRLADPGSARVVRETRRIPSESVMWDTGAETEGVQGAGVFRGPRCYAAAAGTACWELGARRPCEAYLAGRRSQGGGESPSRAHCVRSAARNRGSPHQPPAHAIRAPTDACRPALNLAHQRLTAALDPFVLHCGIAADVDRGVLRWAKILSPSN
jgi:hypothetical protein